MTAASDMVSCERVVELLLEYLEGDLPPELHVAMDTHFQRCPGCVQFSRQYERTPVVCREQLARTMPDEVRAHVLEFLRKEIGG